MNNSTLVFRDLVGQNTVHLYSAAASIQPTGNLLISPISILYASMLLYLGSSNKTESNLASSLHLDTAFRSDKSLALASFARTLRDLSPQEPIPNLVLQMNNGIFLDNSKNFSEAYVRNCSSELSAEVGRKDFAGEPRKAREEINRWVANATAGKILQALPDGSVSKETLMVLVNTLYFNAHWLKRFNPQATVPRDFYLLNGETVHVPMMKLSGNFPYAEDDDAQYLQLDYVGKAASMIIILPKKNDGIRQIEGKVTAERLRDSFGVQLKKRRIHVSLPKFKVASDFDLKEMMRRMGVTEVFQSGADLTEMVPAGDVYVNTAVHRTFIDADEKGTEAAAVTAMSMTRSARPYFVPRVPQVFFTVDHPFMFLIRHAQTGAILFVGRVETLP